MPFLNQFERNLIKRDFSDFLKSFETCHIDIHYKVPVGPTDTDEVYNVTTASSWKDKHISCKASQQIIVQSNQKILAWGILVSGDCLFYILDSIDLTFIRYNSARIVCNDQEWKPIPIDNKVLLDYLGFRLGDSQVAQIIPCRTKQG